jgi:hypothetical protein
LEACAVRSSSILSDLDHLRNSVWQTLHEALLLCHFSPNCGKIKV